LLQTDNHTSTPPFSFLQAGCPSCRPTNSVKALKENTHRLHQHNIYKQKFTTQANIPTTDHLLLAKFEFKPISCRCGVEYFTICETAGVVDSNLAITVSNHWYNVTVVNKNDIQHISSIMPQY